MPGRKQNTPAKKSQAGQNGKQLDNDGHPQSTEKPEAKKIQKGATSKQRVTSAASKPPNSEPRAETAEQKGPVSPEKVILKTAKRRLNFPKVDSQIKLLRANDPAAEKYLNSAIDDESPFTEEFYNNASTFVISHNLRIRMHWSRYYGCYYFYLCRRNVQNTITVIRWSLYESLDLLEELERFFTSLDSHEKFGKEALEPIDYFEDYEIERLYEHEDRTQSWEEFFKKSDFRLSSLCFRWAHSRTNNQYSLILHNPVPQSKALYSWNGPVLFLNTIVLRNLLEYLQYAHRLAVNQPEEEAESEDLVSEEMD